MSGKTVYFKSMNLLAKEIKKKDNIEVFKEQNYLVKLFKKEIFPDIYFHSGNLNKKAMKYIQNSKLTITNSFSSMNLIIEKTKISKNKMEVIYPSVDILYQKPKELKNKYIEKFNLSLDTKLIFFTAKNFKIGGIKEFLQICSNLTYTNFKVIITGNKRQMSNLKLSLGKFPKLKNRLILLEDYTNIDELFLISDIFLLPTQSKTFATNILKAMFCECVVFLPITNDAREIIDTYSYMEKANDPNTSFKIDAILYDENELENIKKENRLRVLKYTLENNLKKFNQILSKI